MERYKIIRWHGEHATIFEVVDTLAPDEEQPAVVFSSTSQYFAQLATVCGGDPFDFIINKEK